MTLVRKINYYQPISYNLFTQQIYSRFIYGLGLCLSKPVILNSNSSFQRSIIIIWR